MKFLDDQMQSIVSYHNSRAELFEYGLIERVPDHMFEILQEIAINDLDGALGLMDQLFGEAVLAKKAS